MTSSDAPENPRRIRLTNPASVVAAVPHLLGFRPERSAVIIFVDDEKRHIALTVRLDLPTADLDLAEWLSELGKTSRYVEATEVIVVIVDDVINAIAPELPHEELVEAISHRFERQGFRVLDALLVGREKSWSYLCDNPTCCAPEGKALEGSEWLRLNAEFAYEGQVVQRSRGDIADRVSPITDEWATEVAECCDDPSIDDLDADELLDVLTLSTGVDSVVRNDAVVASQVLSAFTNVMARDAVIVDLVRRVEVRGARGLSNVIDTLCSLVRVAPSEYVASVASVLAIVAWQTGDGALASCALDRAFDADPSYSLAHLTDAMVRSGVPPQLVRGGLMGLNVQRPAC